MENLAYQIEDTWDEMLNGKIVAMSPRPVVNHNRVSGNIFNLLKNFLKGKKCEAFSDGVDLYLTPTDRFVPDGMVVCNNDIIKFDGVHGAPDLVIEVLSHSTAKRDKVYKKSVYEKSGVKEYWIVEPDSKSIEVYLLKNNTFELDNIYSVFPDPLVGKMNDEEKASIVTEFHPSIFPELTILIKDVFEGVVQI